MTLSQLRRQQKAAGAAKRERLELERAVKAGLDRRPTSVGLAMASAFKVGRS